MKVSRRDSRVAVSHADFSRGLGLAQGRSGASAASGDGVPWSPRL